MATRAVYRLLDTGRLSGPQDGHRFQTGGRTAWTLTFEVQALDGLTDVTLAVEASPTGNADAEFDEIHATTIASVSTVSLSSGFSGRAVNARDVWLRGAVTAVTGTGHYAVRIYASAPFFDPQDDSEDLLYLRRDVRSYDDTGSGEGRVRLVERAEADVLSKLRPGMLGDLKLADLSRQGSLVAMKEAVAEQAEHLHKRELLMMKNDAASAAELRQMPQYAPGLDQLLQPVMWNGSGPVWRGR